MCESCLRWACQRGLQVLPESPSKQGIAAGRLEAVVQRVAARFNLQLLLSTKESRQV